MRGMRTWAMIVVALAWGHAVQGGGMTAEQAADKVARKFMAENKVWGSYTLDIALEALLDLSRLTGVKDYREHTLYVVSAREWTPKTRIAWNKEPFSSLAWALYLETGDTNRLASFMAESVAMRTRAPHTSSGVITHQRDKKASDNALLIDAFQEYAARCARMAEVTGEERWRRACSYQVTKYEAALRNPDNGLWHNARGWSEDVYALSPGAWSRGHGWLLRGLDDCLRHLPRECAEYTNVLAVTRRVSEALLAVQDTNGYWHAMLNLPVSESPVDSSGTGMIAWHWARMIEGGHLPEEPYRSAVLRASAALRASVGPDGTPLHVSPGPGPLVSDEPYRINGSFPPGNAHGVFALIQGFMAEMLSR